MASKIKLGLIGDMGVGKTCIVQRFCSDKYIDQYQSTIGIEISEKEMTVDNEQYLLQIWDTAGQERFHSLSRVYFNDIKGLFIVFSMTSTESLLHCKDWLDDFYSTVDQTQNIPVVLIGNKLDLVEDPNSDRVPEETIKKFISTNEIELYFETSSKENINIDTCFNEMLSVIIKRNLAVVEEEPGRVDIADANDETKSTTTNNSTGCYC
ncbi:GTP-binding protein YPT7 [Entamoeba marina]